MPTKYPDHGPEPESFGDAVGETVPALAVLLVNERGKILAASPEARFMLPATSANSSLSQSLLEIVQEAVATDASVANRLVQMGNGSDQAVVEVTVQRLASNSDEKRLALILSGRKNASPERDLSRLHRLASAGTLSASMAHEIKNALVAGKTFVELLLEKHEDSELVEIVRREMERIDTLVSQMLKFSRPPRSAHTPVKVHDILDLSLRLIQPQFKSKSINVNRSLNAPDDVIKGDEQQLEQAFVNLLINSMEAMGPNGRLEIETSGASAASDGEAAALLAIKITDNGGGITAENLKHLFEPFFTTKKHGTGLGLAITRKIIMEHHGEVRARSRPGSGATFEILLPLAQS